MIGWIGKEGAIANCAASQAKSKFWIASLQGSDRATGSFELGDRPQTQLEMGDRGTRRGFESLKPGFSTKIVVSF